MTFSSNAQAIQKSFTDQAKNFESKTMHFSKEEYLKYMVSSIRPQKSDLVLEVASGTCVCSRALAPCSQKVTCLDMTPAMLKAGREAAAREGIGNMEFILGDAEKLPFPDSSFDIVFSRFAFHHFPQPELCFGEMERVLKPGGKLIAIDMEAAEEALRSRQDEIETLRDPSHVRNLSRNEFLEMFEKHRLTVQTVNCTEISVSLISWMKLTNTPCEVSAQISQLFENEINGGELTGFTPCRKDNDLCFNQHWLMIIGKKADL